MIICLLLECFSDSIRRKLNGKKDLKSKMNNGQYLTNFENYANWYAGCNMLTK